MSIKQFAYSHAAKVAGLPLPEVTYLQVGQQYRVLRPGHHLDGKIGRLEYTSGEKAWLAFNACAICCTPLDTLQEVA